MHRSAVRFVVVLVSSFVLHVAAGANTVWVVSGATSGGDFDTVQQAVTAASDGDIILVQDGGQGEPVIDGKSLTLIRDPSGLNAPVFHGLTIRNLSASQRVVVRGIRVGVNNIHFQECTLTANAGPVFIEDCEMYLRIKDCSRVVISNSELRGVAGADITNPQIVPSEAMRIENSECSLYDSRVIGGRGGSAGYPPFLQTPVPSQAGAPGIDFVSGSLLLAKTKVWGGNGGGGALINGMCWPSSDGGPGVIAGDDVTLMDSAITPGGYFGDPPGCPPGGTVAPPILVTTGTVQTLAELVPELWVTSPAALGGGPVWTVLRGQPGEFALLLLSANAHGAYEPAVRGALVGGPPLLAIPLGNLDANGELQFQTSLAANLLPPSIDGVTLFEQFAVPGATGFGLLSSPSFVVIVRP